MTENEPATDPANPAPGRFVVGASVFALGMLCPLFIPLVATSELSKEWKATLSGALLLGGPEVLMLVAAAILGRSGYEAMKLKLASLLRQLRPADRVGPVRHRVGVAMFALPVLLGWLYPYVVLWLNELAQYELALALALDAVFVSSLFVLGGDFWDKLRELFARTQAARSIFPATGEG